VEVKAQPAWVHEVREGLIVRIDAFLDRSDAFAFTGIMR
jgi:hypothetical protein